MDHKTLPRYRRALCLLTLAPLTAAMADTGLLSPVGYTGAINTPTADVLPHGSAALSLSNSNPEKPRLQPNEPFGSLNAGVGLLPGVEVAGRLSFEGNLQCNLYLASCPGYRDLSVGAKAQLPLPWELPLRGRTAVGISDYGGAATHYRQAYAVGTFTPIDTLDVSVGYGYAISRTALLEGVFGSAQWRWSDRLSAVVENDSRHWRAGLSYRQPLTRRTDLQLMASRKLSGPAAQQAMQWTVGLQIQLDDRPSAANRLQSAQGLAELPASMGLFDATATPAAPANVVTPSALAAQARAQSVADGLAQAGFSGVQVRQWPGQQANTEAEGAGVWWVRAEPTAWRQSHQHALAAALKVWMEKGAQQPNERLWLQLTFQSYPTAGVWVTADCLQHWASGRDCDTAGALAQGRGVDLPAAVRALLTTAPQAQADAGASRWWPQFELGPYIDSTVGTEYGLADYAAGLDVGAEVGLAPGLQLQGFAMVPVSHSGDFDDGKVFGDRRLRKAELAQAMLTYWRPLPYGLDAQLAAGWISQSERGAQIDAQWTNSDGRWRVTGTAGRYTSENDRRLRQPMLGSVRWQALPGAWDLEFTAGRYMGGDEGWRVRSVHWFGDTRFSLYFRTGASPAKIAMPQRSFLGFEFSVPLGPKQAAAIGPVTVRGRDRWGWGLETKVGETDNYLTRGYGMMPRLRHGLLTDISDHDRLVRHASPRTAANLRALFVEALAR